MATLLYILLATILTSLLGLVGVFSLWVKKKTMDKILIYLVSFSAGALLGGAFLHLLPESLKMLDAGIVLGIALFGFILFMLIEGYFHWHHCDTCNHPFTRMMLFGDAVHNFIDGLVIAAAFFIEPVLGIITTLMIIGHEVPQEIGLFGVLLYGKYKRKKALLYSLIAQSTVILGGIVGYLASSIVDPLSTYLLPFAAGGFVYIAAADLIPKVHDHYKGKFSASVKVLFWFAIGLLLMLGLKLMFE